MRIVLLLQYDGTNYAGWQVQKESFTVQGKLEEAIEKQFDYSTRVTGSGRTDSGVHALGQVAHFELETSTIPPENIWKALNRHLPRDIRVIASQLAARDFHSRFNAVRREYQYDINLDHNVLRRNEQWFVPYPLEIIKLQQLSRLIQGTHDFSSFCFAGTETNNMTCCIIEADWQIPSHDTLRFTISGDRFLHHMVRMLVGSMVEVARGKWDVEHFGTLINNPDRKAHVITAPARGLTLMRVSYPADLQPNWENPKRGLRV